jgi:peroxiredoxin
MIVASEPLATALAQTAAATPPDIAGQLESANRDLAASGVAPGLKVGERAPGFALPDQLGRTVSLDEQLARGPVVLVFYRGDWCPFCNLTLRALQDERTTIQAAGAHLIAVSPQAPDRAVTLSERHRLQFPVLSDVSQTAIAAYRLQYEVAPELRDLYAGRFGNDLREQNADETWRLPVPATFVIDQDGLIRARFVDADHTKRMEPAEIVASVAALSSDGRR